MQTAEATQNERVTAWTQEIDQLFATVESWAVRAGWGTLRRGKIVQSEDAGEYEIPVLLIHLPQGRLLLDPVSWNRNGHEGYVEFCAYPSFDSWPLILEDGNWRLFDEDADRSLGRDWNETDFRSAAERLVRRR
jgi:hypothetical protein